MNECLVIERKYGCRLVEPSAWPVQRHEHRAHQTLVSRVRRAKPADDRRQHLEEHLQTGRRDGRAREGETRLPDRSTEVRSHRRAIAPVGPVQEGPDRSNLSGLGSRGRGRRGRRRKLWAWRGWSRGGGGPLSTSRQVSSTRHAAGHASSRRHVANVVRRWLRRPFEGRIQEHGS